MDRHLKQIGHRRKPHPIAAAFFFLTLAAARPSGAADAPNTPLPIMTSDTWKVRSTGDLTIDGGLVLAAPAALPTGMSTGFGVGLIRGRTFAWGARASWSTATESTQYWTVSQSDLRLRAVGALQHAIGRARLSLRLGVGATVVHENSLRIGGSRGGITGSALQTSATGTLPAADLEGVVALHIAGPWILMLSGGPSANLLDGGFHGGWTAGTGVAWQP